MWGYLTYLRSCSYYMIESLYEMGDGRALNYFIGALICLPLKPLSPPPLAFFPSIPRMKASGTKRESFLAGSRG